MLESGHNRGENRSPDYRRHRHRTRWRRASQDGPAVNRVLVTGGAGFIGSTLCDALLARGDEVTAVDNLSTGTLTNLNHATEHASFTFIKGDVRDARLVQRVMADQDAVVHLAARIGLRLVVESPIETIESNIHGTKAVLDAAARHATRTIVASTSEVYGLATRHPSSESDPITFGSPTRGRWSYACSKACDEFLALALQRERGLPATVVRLFNTVGPRQSARYGMVLPRFVRQALAGEPLTVYGGGTQTRSFCHVFDVIDALTTLIDHPVGVGDVFNIGNPAEISVLDLARTVIARTRSASGITFVPFTDVFGNGFEEIERRVPDIAKARAELGFFPSRTLESVIDEVAMSVTGDPRQGPALSPTMAGHHADGDLV
jgi:UDP-glucose 4-epimerase